MTAKRKKICECGALMTYYSHARSWRCNQTGQLSENCNQVPLEVPEPEPEPDVDEVHEALKGVLE